MREIGINMHAKVGLSDEEYLSYAKQLGFTRTFSLTLDASAQASLALLCERYGVICETLHAPFSHINDIWHDTLAGDDMLSDLLQAVDHCKIAGADIAVVHLSSGVNAPPVTDIGRARFENLVEYAAKNNVKIAFENQRLLSNIAFAFETFAGDHYGDTVGFCWDTGHEMCLSRGRRYMPLFGDRILCTHIQDNLCKYNGDLHYIPFDGTLDWNYVASELNKVNFMGTLMFEGIASLSHSYDDLSVHEYLERAADAMKRLRNLVDGI